MRAAIVGAGAVGAVIADAAIRAGHDVTVCARTPITSLVVERDSKVIPLRATFVSDPVATGGKAAVVFVTVKVTDNPSVAGWLFALCAPDTLVVAVQNGLGHEARLAPYAPVGTRIVPGLAYVGAERLGPGRVRHAAGRTLVVPAGDQQFVGDLLEPAMEVRGVDDMITATWHKMLGNLAANPITALTLRRIDVFRDPAVIDLARGLLLEAVEVGHASGANVGPADIESAIERIGSHDPEVGSSMLYDRLAGRPTEHQYLTGEVVRRGAELEVPTPLNRTILTLLDAIDPAHPPHHGSELHNG